MCGIAGIFRFKSQRPVDTKEICGMTDMLAHRGPDGSGIYTDGDFGFGHRRLSIIDTSSRASQPMSSADGTLHISFNGEIYNYLELRAELENEGVRFRTKSDTEVLIELFRARGPKCLRQLNGMFAFAIWNSRDRSLFLARDNVGIKPLYVAFHDEGMVFASEIKSLLLDRKVGRAPNAKVLDSYLRFGYVAGDQTMFNSVSRLLPGHFMQISDCQVITECYWDIEYTEPLARKESDYIEEAAFLMSDAVRLQLRSDVPLGVFLSGGVDSSAIVALTQSHGDRELNTYSVSWDHGRAYNESIYARQVSKQFNTTHHEYQMTSADFRDGLEKFTWLMDEPVTEAAALSLYQLAQVARKDVTVVLSGEGSDEVFGGYPIYLFMQLVEQYKQLPATFRRRVSNPLLSLLGAKARKYVRLSELSLESSYMGVSFYDRDSTYSLLTTEASELVNENPVSDIVSPFYAKTEMEDPQRRMQYLDFKTWLVDDLLIKADRMTMGASQELRVPFLDFRLMEFSARLPPRLRIKHMQPKYLMKKAMERYLPREIIYRKKRGFPTPIARLFRSELRDYLGDILSSRQFRERGLFRRGAVDLMLQQHGSGQVDHHRTLWQLLVLENWHRVFIDPAELSPLQVGDN